MPSIIFSASQLGPPPQVVISPLPPGTVAARRALFLQPPRMAYPGGPRSPGGSGEWRAPASTSANSGLQPPGSPARMPHPGGARSPGALGDARGPASPHSGTPASSPARSVMSLAQTYSPGPTGCGDWYESPASSPVRPTPPPTPRPGGSAPTPAVRPQPPEQANTFILGIIF